MTVDSVTSPELLAAELAAIEDLLQNYEDWRAWAQLEARERQGELPPAVAASGLKTLLLDKLANNTLFLRRQALVKQLEHVTAQARSRPRAADEADDLTRIRGIDVRLERRLNNLAVRSWHQIAQWTPADVHYFASTLGLGDLIARDAWIEQAAVLSGLPPRAPAVDPVVLKPPQDAVPQPAPADPMAAAAEPAPARVALPDPETPAPAATASAAPAGRDELEPAPRLTPPAPEPPAAPVQTQPPESQPLLESKIISGPRATCKPESPAVVPAGPGDVKDLAELATPAAAHAGPDYPPTEPVRPLPASAYAGYAPKPPSLPPLDRAILPLKTAVIGQAALAPHAPEPEYSDLDPPAGAPAWYYEGAPVEPPHGLPALPATPVPLAAAAYAEAYDVVGPAMTVARALKTSKPDDEADATASLEDQTVLQTQLPPLALQPAKSALVLPPVAAPTAMPAAAVEPAPSAAHVLRPANPTVAPVASQTRAPVTVPPATPQATPAQIATIAAAAAAAAASASPAATAKAARAPEDLLKAVAERAQQMAAQPLPPPLPPAATAPPPPLPGATRPASAQPATPRATARGDAISSNLPEALRGSAPEARVTIRRPDEATATPPVIRNPGGTDVHLSRLPAGRFDGEGYAAYHSEVEEAAVQIVKKTPRGVPATRRAVPPLQATPPVQADPVAGARAAAEAAARAAAALAARSAAQSPVQPPVTQTAPPTFPQADASEQAALTAGDPTQIMKKGAEKAAATMGRFLKALTGQ